MYYEAGYSAITSNIFMCAGYRKGGKDTCGVNTGMLSQNHLFTSLQHNHLKFLILLVAKATLFESLSFYNFEAFIIQNHRSCR